MLNRNLEKRKNYQLQLLSSESDSWKKSRVNSVSAKGKILTVFVNERWTDTELKSYSQVGIWMNVFEFKTNFMNKLLNLRLTTAINNHRPEKQAYIMYVIKIAAKNKPKLPHDNLYQKNFRLEQAKPICNYSFNSCISADF